MSKYFRLFTQTKQGGVVTGDSSVALYPRTHVSFFGDECEPGERDKEYRKLCYLLIRRHLHNLHSQPRAAGAPPRFSIHKSLAKSYEAWFQMWEAECLSKFDIYDGSVRRKLQVYGAIGASFLRTYWLQNENLKDPFESYASNQRLSYAHPHAQTGGDVIEQYVSQIREVSPRWISNVRPSLIRSGRVIDRYNPVVLVIFKADFWEYAPEIEVRRDYKYVACDRRPLRTPEFVNRACMAYRAENPTCIRATWLYKKINGDYPVAVVFYQLLTGICCAAWPQYVPKVQKRIPPKPKKGEDQYGLDFIQPVHPYPFEAAKVQIFGNTDVPWADIRRAT